MLQPPSPTSPNGNPWEQNSEGGKLYSPLERAEAQEDGQSPSALLPLSALMTLDSIVGTVTHVAAIAG